MTDVGILGADAVRGDPAALDRVRSFLQRTADQVQNIRGTAPPHDLGYTWEGTAADAFGILSKDLEEDLDKAISSYTVAAGAMTRFSPVFSDAHQMASHLAAELERAQHEAAAQATAYGDAHVAHETASLIHRLATDPGLKRSSESDLTDARAALNHAARARDVAQDRIRDIRLRARCNRQDLDQAGLLAREELIQASHLGLRNRSGLSGFLHDGGHVLSDVGSVFVQAADTPGRIASIVEDVVAGRPAWKNLSRLLADISAAGTIAVVVLAVASVPASGGTSLVALGEAIAIVKVGKVGVDGLKTGVDGIRVARNEPGARIDLSSDALNIGLDVIGVRSKIASAREDIRHVTLAKAARTDEAKVVHMRSGDQRRLARLGNTPAQRRTLDAAQSSVTRLGVDSAKIDGTHDLRERAIQRDAIRRRGDHDAAVGSTDCSTGLRTVTLRVPRVVRAGSG